MDETASRYGGQLRRVNNGYSSRVRLGVELANSHRNNLEYYEMLQVTFD
jgi:hypothetical protein